ncbi:unnamed protein product [Anisakis simplex]|uniref:Uncharacterized protein n=1 Tax=Anisakis simplex TaxID=6269 RepID=A0A3P6U5H4_ANISI|nr:unnamed protein product [Anisakis simplex]
MPAVGFTAAKMNEMCSFTGGNRHHTDNVLNLNFRFQDLDMIASIVAKEQAMLKVNSAARVDQNSLANLALPHRHPQVIVNGSKLRSLLGHQQPETVEDNVEVVVVEILA